MLVYHILFVSQADVDVSDPKRILERSFYFFQRHRLLPKLRARLDRLEAAQRKRRDWLQSVDAALPQVSRSVELFFGADVVLQDSAVFESL